MSAVGQQLGYNFIVIAKNMSVIRVCILSYMKLGYWLGYKFQIYYRSVTGVKYWNWCTQMILNKCIQVDCPGTKNIPAAMITFWVRSPYPRTISISLPPTPSHHWRAIYGKATIKTTFVYFCLSTANTDNYAIQFLPHVLK